MRLNTAHLYYILLLLVLTYLKDVYMGIGEIAIEDPGIQQFDQHAADAGEVFQNQFSVNDISAGEYINKYIDNLHFTELNGAGIFVRQWLPKHTDLNFQSSSLLILPGIAVHAGWYNNLAAILSANGIQTYVMDYPGFGRSGGLRGHIDSYHSIITAITQVTEEICRQNEGEPLFILGHSMGGMLATIYASMQSPLGIILINPWVKDNNTTSLFTKGKLFTQAVLNSKRLWRMFGSLELFSRDEQIIKKLRERNPSLQYLFTPGFLFQMGLLMRNHAQKASRKVKSPALLICGLDDQLVPLSAYQEFYEKLTASPDKTRIDFQGGHDPELEIASSHSNIREAVTTAVQCIISWIEDHSNSTKTL